MIEPLEAYIIRNIQEPDEYWSNTYGWIELGDGADIFTHDERHTLRLPLGGIWVKMVEYVN